MASFHHCIKSGKKGTAANHAAYITRQGKYSQREDLICIGHGNMPAWAKDNPSLFWKAGDKHERANGAVYREHEIALPAELTLEQQEALAVDMVKAMAGDKPYQFAMHSPRSALEGKTNTHLHLMFSDRMQDGIERSPEQTFCRYNAKHPERGGCRKDSGGKNRLALRDEVIQTRKTCAELQNAALERHGHTARVDHRTLKERGIGRTPERHLGPARINQMSSEEKTMYVANRERQP
ncbi:DNA strand transferase [Burkholderia pseudomallei]|uniref:MobA/MobL family protein n=1 Tax=Burkholderia pseudomallei TaxID=28450 RepID=UPI000F04F310|nr:MobA/MobL family protein [Burkholderia pseudomallei]CAJ5232782.1 DNA strand transferase [Burkholderia pseudomallei]CAJ7565452.1 DNA strand transferase [Burkholderia pseudomallei]CAK0348374.1 DNA strand transferase [Burkholderia pseudomallei]VCH22770.1 DNA strand transferase [Burkholderia pseudomallei]VCH61683.1 DNA strand transferase [Burkholderia pseudomallei]